MRFLQSSAVCRAINLEASSTRTCIATLWIDLFYSICIHGVRPCSKLYIEVYRNICRDGHCREYMGWQGCGWFCSTILLSCSILHLGLFSASLLPFSFFFPLVLFLGFCLCWYLECIWWSHLAEVAPGGYNSVRHINQPINQPIK